MSRLQSDVEALLLGPRTVIGEVQAFLDEGVDIDKSVFPPSPLASAAACS
jgi:hypothetical protein